MLPGSTALAGAPRDDAPWNGTDGQHLGSPPASYGTTLRGKAKVLARHRGIDRGSSCCGVVVVVIVVTRRRFLINCCFDICDRQTLDYNRLTRTSNNAWPTSLHRAYAVPRHLVPPRGDSTVLCSTETSVHTMSNLVPPIPNVAVFVVVVVWFVLINVRSNVTRRSYELVECH